MKTSNDEKNGAISLVLGILCIVLGFVPFLGLILAILAIIFANKQNKEKKTGPATAGLVLGILGTVGGVIYSLVILSVGTMLWGNSKNIAEENYQSAPVNINEFRVIKEGELMKVYFSLEDASGGLISADGTITLKILDRSNNTLYEKLTPVSQADFMGSSYTLGYEVKIPTNEIKKGVYQYGTAELSFETNWDILKAENSFVEVPYFSEEELSSLAEEGYQKNAISLDVTKKMDNYISITVNKIGLMSLNDKKYIRVDITVKNIGNEKISYYSPNPIILGGSSNQFEEAYVSSYDYKEVFDNGDIYPGVIKSGALFFETDKNPQLDVKELIIQTDLLSWDKQERNIGDGQSLLYDKEYVFNYDISKVTLS